MAALVQTVPQQTGSITLLQPQPQPQPQPQHQHQHRPASSSQASQQPPHHNPQQHQAASSSSSPQMARGNKPYHYHYNSHSNNTNTNNNVMGYRGTAPTQPVAPYAFTSTPSLASHSQPRPPQVNNESYPPLPPPTQPKNVYPGVIPPRGGQAQLDAGSVSSSSAASSTRGGYRAQDDFALPTRTRTTEMRPRPASTADLTLPPVSIPPMQSSTQQPTKPAQPDRYRRGQRRGGDNHTMPYSPVSSPQQQRSASPSTPNGSDKGNEPATLPSFAFPSDWNTNTPSGHVRGGSADDARIKKTHSTPELAKRYRRRSVGSLDTAGLMNLNSAPIANQDENKFTLPEIPSVMEPPRPTSSGSSSSQKSADKSEHRPTSARRSKNPSPLSNNLSMSNDETQPQQEKNKNKGAKDANANSPAAQQLTEISKKSKGKGRKKSKSRFRRAFSFGSAADMENAGKTDTDKESTTRKQQLDEELGAEQAAIAEQQEAAGLGENIYSGQGGIFSGSTDNLSLASTASSASMMLRKMGKGMKKGTRSIISAFRHNKMRPEGGDSTENAPAPEPTTPQVSMVTVEAQPRKIPVPVPRDSMEGRKPSRDGTVEYASDDDGGAQAWGFDENGSDTNARKSIVGGDRERAEVLATIRKGILKSHNSPVVKPVDGPAMNGSNPSSPAEQLPPPRSGHRRTDSVTIEGDDYFLPAGRVNGNNAASAPVTPQASGSRNISFSPRIQFHDTWPSGEYDRRGEPATCNRLTPLLAQQIKEELNTFKMEMEVHESSKVYTHFF